MFHGKNVSRETFKSSGSSGFAVFGCPARRAQGQGGPLYQIPAVYRQAKSGKPAGAWRYAAALEECPNFSSDTVAFAANAAKMQLNQYEQSLLIL
ncbi:hypothetical protein QEV83_08330 [Methylocapsa sp. D3K7]|uniref:hypothetical protein n=1 Tax=Methylocapsa sp. D3K7 TaxID=3041435 RepID=UPI00244EDFA4|nr:hypothetical protein [Methylocapsa sp. D3K7]WGJ16231.1 hypothetical protein QEV83_08330 [Methylocapsa sp. D3K7]